MSYKLRAPKPEKLKEEETLSSFESWKGNLEYYLALDENFAEFLDEDFVWEPKSKDAYRGMTDIKAEDGSTTKSAAQRSKFLDICLGQIAGYATVISRATITRDCCSMKEIFNKLRAHYGFSKSGGSILDVMSVKRRAEESPETLYQRILTLVDSTLLCVGEDINHHGQPPNCDEERTPALENLVICLWLKALHPSLPQLIKQRFATDLRFSTLASIREEISGSIAELLSELGERDTPPSPNVFQASSNNRSFNNFRPRMFGQQNRFQRQQFGNPRNSQNFPRFQNNISCTLCKQAGRKETNHYLSYCPYLTYGDRQMFSNNRVRNVECPQAELDIDPYYDFSSEMAYNLPQVQDNIYPYNTQQEPYHNPIGQVVSGNNITQVPPIPENQPPAQVNRVATAPSPAFNVTHNNHVVKLTQDCGATVNLLKEHTANRLNIEITPASQSAHQCDGVSNLTIVGEVRTTFYRNDTPLYFEGLVVRNMESEVLCGMPFQIANDITVRGKRNEIWIGDHIKFNYQP